MHSSTILNDGVYPPMLTPFGEDGRVAYDAFERNIDTWNRSDLGGYVALGSNSETPYLSDEERRKLVEITVRTARKGATVIAGTGGESTAETIRRTEEAAKLGAAAALVLPPFYYSEQMTDRVIIEHFTRLADASPIPILLYHVPRFTHVSLPVPVIATLSRHPNIGGMKDSSGDVPRLAAIMKTVSPAFRVFVGTASAWYPALTLGVRAGIMALANIAPNQCIEVQRLFEEGKMQEARDLYARLLPLNVAVTATYGVPGLKFAAQELGYEAASLRRPLLPLQEKEQDAVRRLVSDAGLGQRST